MRWTKGEWKGLPYQEVGAVWAELEFQRYRSRRALNQSLCRFDIVQVISGTPAWALAVQDYQGPVALQMATLVANERWTRLRQERGVRGAWLRLMTHVTTLMEQAALQRIDAVFVENHWTYKQISQKYSEKTIFAPPGVDSDYFYPVSYQPDSYILSVGRFSDPRKNTRLLFEAYYHLRQAMPDAPKLILAGLTSPLQNDLDYAISVGIASEIEIRQDVSVAELRSLYQNASLFVLSSDEEGLGIVILEAMACGVPIVSTSCGGPETSIVEGETGYLVPVGDALELALKMQYVLQDAPLRQQMSQACRQTVERRFSIASAGKVYVEKYDALMDKAV